MPNHAAIPHLGHHLINLSIYCIRKHLQQEHWHPSESHMLKNVFTTQPPADEKYEQLGTITASAKSAEDALSKLGEYRTQERNYEEFRVYGAHVVPVRLGVSGTPLKMGKSPLYTAYGTLFAKGK